MLSDAIVTVTHAGVNGVPDEAAFELGGGDRAKTPLDDMFIFSRWEGDALVPFTLPSIGETVAISGRALPIF